ncbi:MAG: B12-binding domain-containing radical SAM protein [Tenuifilaceae bacterium]|nr:B12-binding domain-containing radical SAM protein [Tenuifilaceae bacterium]
MKDLLLITPPFTQLNTPYPATAYLKGFLNTQNISAHQVDLGIEVILELFTKKSFEYIFEQAYQSNRITSANCQRIYALRDDYLLVLDGVIQFLQGKNPTLARQICTRSFLPEASRFESIDDLDWAFGSMGIQDKAKHLATLYLEDLSDFIVECVDENFGFIRYAERLGRSANSFDELYNYLQTDSKYIDAITLQILHKRLMAVQPKLVCFSVPFPGNLYSAFRCAQYIKTKYPHIKVAMGGGFPNTELRTLKDVRAFEFFDYITLDDGEQPIELLAQHVFAGEDLASGSFKRTLLLENGEVVYKNNSSKPDFKQAELGTPDYSDLRLDEYISVIEIANPMHSLWIDGRWNKLTMAHGCYWKKCTFCDVSLDYIGHYEPIDAKILVDRMETLIAQTGETGFHFVDEAAPPALMKALALEILKRKLILTWWTNVRFEKNFTQDLCYLLKASGCIAVSGGLEVASDRLLALIDKGVTVEQVARVTRNFTKANIMVHSYLMYGFPTQTVQETVDSLEMVRQLFEEGIVQSAFWHQFALTAHSLVGLNPAKYGITPILKDITFANNDINFTDQTGINHSQFSFGLKKSLFNFMLGLGFELPLQDWFEFKIPQTKIRNNYIRTCLSTDPFFSIQASSKVVWLGGMPLVSEQSKTKKGKSLKTLQLTFHHKSNSFQISVEKDQGEWLLNILPNLSPRCDELFSYEQLKADFETHFEGFELFWYSKPIQKLRDFGLLVV